MNSSEVEQMDCSNVSFNDSHLLGQPSSELTFCLFGSMISNEVLLKILILTILMLLFFSLVVNIYLLLGLKHSEALSWNPRYKLLKNLIVSDLLITLNFGPPTVYCLLFRETLSFNFKCVAQYFTGTVAIINSLLTVSSMALERFVYTCHGIHYLGIMTNRRMSYFMTLIWLLALTGAGTSTVLALMGGANFGRIIAAFVCEPGVVQVQLEQSKYFAMFNKIFIGAVLFLCLIAFLFSYGRMYQEARRMQQPFRQDNARARRTISFYFAIFLLQLFPSLIKLIALFVKDLDNQVYMIILVLFPPCVNPLAYGIRNKEVRQVLGRLCEWWKLKELLCQ